MSPSAVPRTLAAPLALLSPLALAGAAAEPETAKRPVQGIMDNSFLIEAAYSQPPGVVPSILNAAYGAALPLSRAPSLGKGTVARGT